MAEQKSIDQYLEGMIVDMLESHSSFSGIPTAERISDENENFDYWLATTVGNFQPLRPRFEDLKRIIQASRVIYTGSEIYQNAIWHRRNFILGKFTSFDLLPADDTLDVNETITRLGRSNEVAQLSRNWMQFWKKNKMCSRLDSWFKKWDRDGDVFIRFFEDDDVPSIRFVDATTVQGDVSLSTEAPSDGFTQDQLGIVTTSTDIEEILGYILYNNPVSPTEGQGDYSFVSAEEIIQHKANTDFDTLRGLPRMYTSFTNIRQAEKILTNSSILTTIQTAIAMIRKHDNSTSANVNAFANRRATGQRVDRSTGTDHRTKRFNPGTILDAKGNTTYEFPAHKVNPQSWLAPFEAQLGRVAAAACVPMEWLLSKNISEPLNPGDPYLTNFQYERELFYEPLYDLYWKVQEAMGVDVEATQEQWKLVVHGPTIPTAKALDQARIDDIYIKHNVKSPQQVARENGTSYPVMRAEVIAHRATKQPDEQFPGDAGMTNMNNDGETQQDGTVRSAAGDGGDQR